MQKTVRIGVRADPLITQKLDKVAGLYNIRRSTVIRDLLASCDIVYPVVKDAMLKQDTKLLEERVREAMEDSIPHGIDPVIIDMVGQMVNRIMSELAAKLVQGKED